MKGLVLVFLGVVFLVPSAYRLYERYFLREQQPPPANPNLRAYLRARPGLEMFVYIALLVAVIMLLHSVLSLFNLRVPWFFPIFP